ncbi:MAG: hypothetical protein AABY62_04535 [Pseudomonadota bacterium]
MKAIALVLLIVIAGCQTSQAAVPPDPVPDPGWECLENLPLRGLKAESCLWCFTSEFSIIAEKLALVSPNQQTFGMLSNASKPNAAEKMAIAGWAKARQECYGMTIEWRKQYNLPPTLMAIQDAEHSSFLNLTADLYNGKLTYGEYAKARANIRAQSQQQWAKAAQHLREQQTAADERRRNLALQYLLNQQPSAQPFTPVVPYQMQIPRTTTTNCFVIGNQMRCTTQ